MPAPAPIQAATLQRFILAWKKWNAQEWISTFSDDFEQVTLPLTIRHVIHDPGNNKAAIYAVSKGNLPWGDWNLEYSAFVTFTEDGEKVAKVEEMLDTAFLQDFRPKYEKYLQDHGCPVAVAARGS
ncbi:hypothetical protein Asppvi_005435 [Aspergillus pseudoviridinutans]|uniref:Uncharacterized protein n=1 Tax=Aspergillus pseudoviridinutans TaxID=1517512 RepID=A0A9P3ESL1_9EURO|nr:uncharacterized protein Asppvi_005435 [Aspergillus pseudoviridinutans]GIJ86546.1 hypothetical protein Asppvi_005435 [Aspergillus pseudoviridinutans]